MLFDLFELLWVIFRQRREDQVGPREREGAGGEELVDQGETEARTEQSGSR